MSCSNLLFRNVAAAEDDEGGDQWMSSRTPRALAARCDAMKFLLLRGELPPDHMASARVASATRSFPIPAISCAHEAADLALQAQYLFS
jgi:hypothetical protein